MRSRMKFDITRAGEAEMRYKVILIGGILALLLTATSNGQIAPYDDYLLIDASQLESGTQNVSIPIYVTHQSPTAGSITGGCNGFVVASTGTATWQITDIVSNHSGVYATCVDCDGVSPDFFSISYGSPGIPTGTIDELLATVEMDIGPGTGSICIDSAFIPPSCVWMWTGAGGSAFPRLVDQNGSDASHPICLPVVQGPMEDYIRIGVDSIPAGSSNFEIPFYWRRGCNQHLFGVMNSFEFTTTGDASYTYLGSVTNPYYEWFEWGFTYNSVAMDNNPPDTLLVGGAAIGDYGIFEETWMFSVHLEIGEGEGTICIDSLLPWQWNGPDCDGPYLLDKYSSNVNHPICLTVYPCTDPDCSQEYDIDDVVYLIAYIFSGGSAPHGDPDCSGEIDIDDVVYLIGYIFSSGPPPCVPGDPTVIHGSVDWPGHQLTHPTVFVDTCHTPGLIVPLNGIGFDADENGDFTMSYDLDGPIEGVITGWDDLDGDWVLEAGEPWGWWDANGDGYYTKDDMVPLVPGQVINGAAVSLQFMAAKSNLSGEVRLRSVKQIR